MLKRCILVEVTAQCVKDSVREKRKFGSDKAISMAESLRALYNGTAPLPHVPCPKTHSWATRCNMTLLQLRSMAPNPLSPGSLLYMLYVLNLKATH